MPLIHKTRPALVQMVRDLRSRSWAEDAPIWRDIASRLEKPTRRHVVVNLSKIERNVRDGETALVPGKVLAAGEVTKPVKVAALSFSTSAREKIEKAGGSCLSLSELATSNPKGTGVRIVG